MNKKLFFSIIVIFLLLSCSFCVSAQKYDEEYFEDGFFSVIDDDTKKALDYFGVDDLDFDKIYSVSLSEISEYFSEDMLSSLKSTVSDFFLLLSVILINSVAASFFQTDKKDKTLSMLSTAVVIIIAVQKLNPLINVLLSTMKLNGDFILAFIPIFTLLVALSGSPGGAVTYNTLALLFSEGISAFINNFASQLLGGYFCLAISFSMNRMMNINRFLNTVNRITGFAIGFLACVFSALLSIKGVLSVSIDSASAKGIKFLLSSLIPIVGSSISDAYSSLVGSMSLIKGSVAAIAILVVVIISFPAVFEGVLYCISFSLLSYIAELFDLTEISSAMKVFYTGVRILILLSIFESFVLIISTGIMLNMKGGI